MTRTWNKFLFLFMALLVSCSDDPLPEPLIADMPVFLVEGTIGNDSLGIFAGVGEYFMDSFYEQDGLDIYSFGGTFKKANCADCTEELTILIRDRKIMNQGANFVRDLSLMTGNYPIASNEFSPAYIDQVNQFYTNNISLNANPNYEYQWVFNGVDTSFSNDPIFYFPEVNGQTIELTVTDPVQGCQSVWEDEVDFLLPSTFCPFSSLIYDNNADGLVNFLPFIEGVPIDWDFGDNTSMQTDESFIFPLTHAYDTPGIYTVCMEVDWGGIGCVDSFCTQVQSHANVGCSAGFDTCPCPFDSYFFSHVELRWVAADGRRYSSFATTNPTPNNDFFIITAIEPYFDDLDGDKTMRVTATAKVTLFNEEDPSDTLLIETGELTFAVAYPDL